MPFRLMNALSTFQRMMDTILPGVSFVRVHHDEVVVFSKNLEKHLRHLQQLLDVIDEAGPKLKLTKCNFAQAKIKLIGHIVDKSGIDVDLGKFEEIRNAPIPTTTTELKSFLGLASYYRRFIYKFADIAAILFAATSGNARLKWTGEIPEAFQELRIKLTSPPVLAYPDFEKPFIVETDASSVSVGAVLAQKTIQYASRSMNTSERKYSACERESLAILKGFHEDIGHWDLKTTRQFVTERYWWPTVYMDVRDYVKSGDGCQMARPILKYKNTLRFPISSLFDVFCVDFGGPFPATSFGKRFLLVAVEHLTGWPIAIATADSTAQVVLDFVKREIMYSFGPPQTIVPDNVTSFTASAVLASWLGTASRGAQFSPTLPCLMVERREWSER
ncbi:unnamed protein product [Chondrus crispus]|uniref:Integrase catalytic domain-containing protein n=1 Tax=Chondrus crispus TaxID=2769 RepID=R7Q5W9_CHOCR|nr:unnamed protein product [Chondrus crispus]CDF33409.1 unnamed protein product [Chondrus crispus]|eukprot:XP_005713212.1 unnamed protein product [Chondrus crispus]